MLLLCSIHLSLIVDVMATKMPNGQRLYLVCVGVKGDQVYLRKAPCQNVVAVDVACALLQA